MKIVSVSGLRLLYVTRDRTVSLHKTFVGGPEFADDFDCVYWMMHLLACGLGSVMLNRPCEGLGIHVYGVMPGLHKQLVALLPDSPAAAELGLDGFVMSESASRFNKGRSRRNGKN